MTIKTINVTNYLREKIPLLKNIRQINAKVIALIALIISLPITIPNNAMSDNSTNDSQVKITIQKIISDKGVTFYLGTSDFVPIITISGSIAQGSLYDPIEKQGLHSLMSDMLTQGAGELDQKTFNEKINELSANISFSTSHENLNFSLTMLKEKLSESYELFKLALNKPRFDEKSFNTIKQIRLSDLKFQASSPSFFLSKTFKENAYEGRPEAKQKDGTVETVKSIQLEDIRSLYQGILNTEQLELVIVGDISQQEAKKLVDEVFGSLPKQPPNHKAPSQYSYEINNLGKKVFENFDMPQRNFITVIPTLSEKHELFFSSIVLNEILGGNAFSSRLFKEIREEKGLTYGIYSYVAANQQNGYLAISGASNAEKFNEVESNIKSILEDLADNGPSEEEFNIAKDHLIGAYILRFDSNYKIASQIHGALITNRGADYYLKRNNYIKAVTFDSIKQVASMLLRQNSLTVSIGK